MIDRVRRSLRAWPTTRLGAWALGLIAGGLVGVFIVLFLGGELLLPH